MKSDVLTTPRTAMAIGAVLALCLFAAAPAGASSEPITISVLSGRADLVSGGDALVRIGGVSSTQGLKVTAGGVDRTGAFAKRANGTVVGIVRGLKLGRSTIIARVGDRAAQLTVTNHPKSGPIFFGPQLKPWKCQATAKDAQCNEPAKFTYVYKSTDPSKSGFQPYDPANPPSDVATTRTGNGHTLPFIVRIETGYLDRDQYQIAVLFQPGKPWSATAPQRQFNHKLLIHHGASCGADHQTGTAPGVTNSEAEQALGLGFAAMSHALDNAGHNCNLASEAESLIMTKEYLIDHYGTLRYTIGTGCSGGSLAEQWIANAYPGVYQGIMPTCSFPDAWSTATQFLDYHQTLRYFDDPSQWGTGVTWTPQQMADVEGGPDGVANAHISDSAQFHVVIPTDHCAGISDQQRYEPTTNPGGVRCTIQDAAINVFGPRPKSVWTPQEKQIGRGFADTPVDNVGVQYGLRALKDGNITPAEFLKLNATVGSWKNTKDMVQEGCPFIAALCSNPAQFDPWSRRNMRLSPDGGITPAPRREGNMDAANAAYTSGIVFRGDIDIPVIDWRHYLEHRLDMHNSHQSFASRKRMLNFDGDASNQVIWFTDARPGTPQVDQTPMALDVMDQWMLTGKKPTRAVDSCFTTDGSLIYSGGDAWAGILDSRPAGKCTQTFQIFSTSRIVAGGPIEGGVFKCALKPLATALADGTYGSWQPSPTDVARLQQIFPTGVCDYTKPDVGRPPGL